MFSKGVLKDEGIDITIKNNPGHILSPDSWDMVLDSKFNKISEEEYRNYYHNLLKARWETRKQEFLDLARDGIDKEIKLKCFCPIKEKGCHAHLAAKFMNTIVEKIKITK